MTTRTLLDINCDLGEDEPLARTRALMQHITSANVACGGHAGDLASMAACAKLAKAAAVNLGAHPGSADGAFGRSRVHLTPAALSLLVVQQVGALKRVAERHGVIVHHVKLHGALYHASETDDDLARAYVITVRDYFPGLQLYSQSGGQVAHLGRRLGLAVCEEIFADRVYHADGDLRPRQYADALLTRPSQVTARVELFLRRGEIETACGQHLQRKAQTLCLHGDTENAIRLARAARTARDRFAASPT